MTEKENLGLSNYEVKILEGKWSNCKYRPEYDKLLEDHLGHGLTFASFDVPDGVSMKTLYDWLGRFPSFALARERGERRRLKLLEAAGIKMVVNGNPVAWKFLMQQHGMVERIEISSGPAREPTGGAPERAKRLERIRELGSKLRNIG